MINWYVNIKCLYQHIYVCNEYGGTTANSNIRWGKNTKIISFICENIINFILIDVRKPITWSISIIVVSHLSQLCRSIPILWWQFHNVGFCKYIIYMLLGSFKRSTYSNNIKLLILCYYLHYIFITLSIVEEKSNRFPWQKKKKGKINFSNLLKGVGLV